MRARRRLSCWRACFEKYTHTGMCTCTRVWVSACVFVYMYMYRCLRAIAAYECCCYGLSLSRKRRQTVKLVPKVSSIVSICASVCLCVYNGCARHCRRLMRWHAVMILVALAHEEARGVVVEVCNLHVIPPTLCANPASVETVQSHM